MSAEGLIDLRSDTVTRPTEAMRRAMASADVGDDCYGEDPTVNRLQDLAAELLGVEAALYVPTGTMANQIALRVLSHPGDEVICDAGCHLIHHESGAAAQLSQVQLRGLPSTLGILEPDDLRAAIRPDDPFQPDTALVAVENTHNAAGGTVWPVERLREIREIARDAGLPVFVDGARLFNACVFSGVSPADYAAHADLVTISLYKGLAAPMGSLVCGKSELVARAWTARRVFGGALRQAGIVAAAGLVALEPATIERLHADHDHARLLAGLMSESAPAGAVLTDRVQTNMVLVDTARAGIDAARILAGLQQRGVLAGLIAPGVIRFVTHCDVDRAGIQLAADAFRTVVEDNG